MGQDHPLDRLKPGLQSPAIRPGTLIFIGEKRGTMFSISRGKSFLPSKTREHVLVPSLAPVFNVTLQIEGVVQFLLQRRPHCADGRHLVVIARLTQVAGW